MEVYLGFTAGDRFWDRGIMLVEEKLEHDTHAPHPLATHAYLIFSYPDIPLRVGYEAVPPRVHAFDAHSDTRPDDRLYRVPCTDEQAEALLAGAKARVGQLYDVAGFAVVMAYVTFGLKDLFYQNRHASIFCSEMVADVLRAAGISVLEGIPACDVTPASLETYSHLCYERAQHDH